MTDKCSILCVANWDSNVGYAWWLMESFWVKIEEHFSNKFEVILVYPSISKIPIKIEKSGLKIIKHDFTFDNKRSIFDQLKLIKEHNVKHIYFSDRANSNWRYIFFYLSGVRQIIVHDHTPGVRDVPSPFKAFLKKIINLIPLYSSTASIGATEYVKQRLVNVNRIPENRCYSAPNGIEIIESSTPAKVNVHARFNIPENRRIIVSVGRANLYKGVEFALKTIKALKDMNSNVKIHYLYLGDGPDIEKIKSISSELGVSDFVSFVGRVNGVVDILCDCYVAFHPSKGEVGYSLSILESMLASLPVVVSDNPSVCEVTGNLVDGFVFPEDDINAAAKALESLIVDSELATSMGQLGAKKVKEKYSLDNCHLSLLNALDQIIKDK